MRQKTPIEKWELDFHIEVDCYPLNLNRLKK